MVAPAVEQTGRIGPIGEDGFRPFQAALAEWPPASPDVSRLVTPSLAKTWAAAVAHFWAEAQAAGRIDPGSPLYVLDLRPIDPRLAASVLPVLLEHLECAGAELRPRYVACGLSDEDAADFRAHPVLAPLVEAGLCDTAGWPAGANEGQNQGQNEGLQLHACGERVVQSINPVVALSFGTLSAGGAELYAIHYGNLLAGEVRRGPSEAEPGAFALQYRWPPAPEAEATPARAILQSYRGALNSAPVLIPSGALQTIEHLRRFSGGRYLLVAADRGPMSQIELRLGALSPPAVWVPGRSALPVDFHALSWFQSSQGARAHNHRSDESGWVLHVAWRDGDGGPDPASFAALVNRLSWHSPADAAHLVELAAATPTPDAALCLLRLSGHEPAVLAALLPKLIDAPELLVDNARPAWREALERTWAEVIPDPAEPRLHTGIAIVAMHLGHFELAREALSAGLDWFGPSAPDLHCLAQVEAMTGRAAEAIPLLDVALELCPDDADCLELRAALCARLARRARLPFRDHATLDDGDLCLEALGPEHAGAFLRQYRDPQIARMTRLPELPTVDAVSAWIAREMEARGEPIWALVHRAHGFVGLVCLRGTADAGYFYFWLGADFQQRGYGGRAAALALRLAGAMGLREVFTTVYPDNARSLRILARAGFDVIDRRDDDAGEAVLLLRAPTGPASGEDPAVCAARYDALFGPPNKA